MMAVWDTTLIKDTIWQTAIGRIGRISFFFFKHSNQATLIIIGKISFQTAILKYSQIELGGHIVQQLITELGGKEKNIKLLKENQKYLLYTVTKN